MLRKMTVLAMALGALAALTLPMPASANWTKHHKAIQQNEQVALTGTVGFAATAGGAVQGGIVCQITSQAQGIAGTTTGVVTTFNPDPDSAGTDTNRCAGNGGFALCQLHNLQPTGVTSPGWTIHTNHTGTHDVTVTYSDIHSQTTGAFCPAKFLKVTASSRSDRDG